jgi:hypothetical protein
LVSTPNVLDGTLHDQLAKSTLDAALMAAGDAAIAKVVGLVGKAVVAAVDTAKIVGGGSSIESAAFAHPLEGMTPSEVIQQVRSLGLNTQRDETLLWSGLGPGRTGIERSQAYAVENGGRTLEMTLGGKWLDQMNLYGLNSPFTRVESDYIWGNVSRSFAQGASGQVRVLQGTVRPSSVYRSIELPTLQANPSVTGIEPINLKPRYNFGK